MLRLDGPLKVEGSSSVVGEVHGKVGGLSQIVTYSPLISQFFMYFVSS